jgi:hypothetical protein
MRRHVAVALRSSSSPRWLSALAARARGSVSDRIISITATSTSR